MYLGIEIGGTKLQLGLGRGDGQMTALWRGVVNPAAGGGGIRDQIVSAVPELLNQARIARSDLHGIGIGFGGPIDDSSQTVIKSHQIAGWDGYPVAEWITGLLGGIPAALGNDADVAGLAEALFGAGKGMSPIFYVTIGSGIGGGLIIDGKIYRGAGRGAGEIGHTIIHSKLTASPNNQTELEKIASGWGIAECAREQVALDAGRSSRSSLLRLRELTARDVVDAARHGDALAADILEETRGALAQALLQVIVLLCPRRIVIGGGVSLIGEEQLFQPLREMLRTRVFPPFAGLTDIVPAALGEEVVVHGALALAMQRFTR